MINQATGAEMKNKTWINLNPPESGAGSVLFTRVSVIIVSCKTGLVRERAFIAAITYVRTGSKFYHGR